MRRCAVTLLAILASLTFSLSAFAQSKSRADIQKEIETARAELASLEKQFLAPSDADRAAFAEFLRQPNTGLIRLLPREIYDSEVYKNNKKTITMRGGGAYYSFSRHTHEYGYGSDIELDSGHLTVGFAGADYGLLCKAGDLALDEITLDQPYVRFLAEYVPPTAEPEVRAEAMKFGRGTAVEGITYQRSQPVEVNTTYLLRSINYSESDVLVAFRVVRKDSDGSVILAWKMLKDYPAPKLVQTASLK